MVLLSICIPTYNRAEYLDQTLEIITSQDIFQNSELVEIVISDNCSTDNTQEICQKYISKYNNKIKYIKQETLIPWERHFFKVLEYGSGKFVKLNNDTCYFKPDELKNTIEYLKANNETEFLFFHNNDKFFAETYNNFDSFLKDISYDITWIGSFCPKKEIFNEFKDNIDFFYTLLPQVDFFGKWFSKGFSITVLQGPILGVQQVYKKGANYNVAEVFGKNYFRILKEYINKNNGITQKTYEKEKKKINSFINQYYFDINNEYSFKKTGYLKYMLPIYILKPYFYSNYIRITIKLFFKSIYSSKKNSQYKEIRIFNVFKFSIKRKIKNKK